MNKVLYFIYNFNRPDSTTVGNNWIESFEGDTTGPEIIGNKLVNIVTNVDTNSRCIVKRNLENYNFSRLPISIKFRVIPRVTAIDYYMLWLNFGQIDSGPCDLVKAYIGSYDNSDNTKINIETDDSSSWGGEQYISLSSGTEYNFEFNIYQTHAELYFYQYGTSKPGTPIVIHNNTTNILIDGNYYSIDISSKFSNHIEIDDFEVHLIFE